VCVLACMPVSFCVCTHCAVMATGIVTGTEIETKIVTMTGKGEETDHVNGDVATVVIEEILGEREAVAEREETVTRRTEMIEVNTFVL